MNLQQLLNSRRVGELGLRLCRSLTPKSGYALADFIAARLAARTDSPLVRGIRANQWVLHDGKLSSDDLDRLTAEVIRHTARAFYLFFHYLDDTAWLREFIVLDDEMTQLIAGRQAQPRGLLVLGVHMCYFDVAMIGLVYHGLQATALSLPEANPMIEWQHDLRRRSGLEIIPASMHNLRLVIQRLQAGAVVATGIDRPMGEVKIQPNFFGRPSHAPVHYIQLALKARVPVRLLLPVLEQDGRIHFLYSPEIEMQNLPDRQAELRYNAERVLEIASGFIARYPQQWGMSWSVWPDALEQLP